MSDIIPPEAVGEVAKATRQAMSVVEGVGHYAAEVFGQIPHDIAGLVIGDWLRHKRLRNAKRLQVRTECILASISVERLESPSPSVFIPLLETSVDEERPVLSELWAKLLANATIDGGNRVRTAFFETLRQMEPSDVAFLEAFDDARKSTTNSVNRFSISALVIKKIGRDFDSSEFDVCYAALIKHGLLSPSGDGMFVTAYGELFLRACKID